MSLFISALSAQERGDYRYDGALSQEEEIRMIEVDTTLFRIPIVSRIDSYSEALRCYCSPVATRRRGLYYTLLDEVVLPSINYHQALYEPLPESRLTFIAAQSGYRVGLSAFHAQTMRSGWTLSSSLWSQTGRDAFVEGVFRNTFSPELTLSRRFGLSDFLRINGSFYYSMRGEQSSSTQEAYSLTGDPYYNPSWGLYHGEVRNARVRRDLSPELSACYQKELAPQTTLSLTSTLNYSRRSNSALGWYNATTPQPDYYRNMPSYLTQGVVQDYVSDLWQSRDADYTQVNWSEMERLNSLSSEGSAYYTLEDKVKRTLDGDFVVYVDYKAIQRLSIGGGLELKGLSSRNFKVMRDLLGADYLMDYDLFLDDSYSKTVPMQNDLQQPDRKVLKGDRFGYDYTIASSMATAVLRIEYRATRLDFNLEANISGQSFKRIGHTEKERFAGALSLGESSEIITSPYTLRSSVGYAWGADKYFALKFVSSRLSPAENTLFLNATMANYLSGSSSGERINSVALAFKYSRPWLLLWGEIYALHSGDGAAIYSLYDDLSGTMCRGSITQIGYRSVGVELTAHLYLHEDLKLSSTLSAGSYRYSGDAFVTLYSDYDLSEVSAATKSQVSGLNIGNAPQFISTLSASYFGLSRYIFGATASYAAQRYEQPSFFRRSERLISQAFVNEQSAQAALSQQRLGDIFDMELSAARYFWFARGGQLSLRLSVKNLLGERDRVTYARESDRVILQSIDDIFSGATMRQGTLLYGAPRSFRVSVSYEF